MAGIDTNKAPFHWLLVSEPWQTFCIFMLLLWAFIPFFYYFFFFKSQNLIIFADFLKAPAPWRDAKVHAS